MGNTRYYTKDNGQSFAELEYDVWGAVTSPSKLVNNDNGNFAAAVFTGHPYDTVLDIYFAEARFYDANHRQWMASDPIKSGLNWYLYVEGNPATFFDPSGLLGEGLYGSLGDSWLRDKKLHFGNGYDLEKPSYSGINFNQIKQQWDRTWIGMQAIGSAFYYMPALKSAAQLKEVLAKEQKRQSAIDFFENSKFNLMSPQNKAPEKVSGKTNQIIMFEDYLDAVGENSTDFSSNRPSYAPKYNSEKINIEAVLDMIMSQLVKSELSMPTISKPVDLKTTYENLRRDWSNSFTSLRDKVFENASEKTKQTILKLERWIDENTWAFVDEQLGGKSEQENNYRIRWPHIDLSIYKENGFQKTYFNGGVYIGELDLDFGKPGGFVLKINGPKADAALGLSEQVLGARASYAAAEIYLGFRSIDESINQGDKQYSDVLIGATLGASKGTLAKNITKFISTDLSNPSSATISFGMITIRVDRGVWKNE